jgi:hypothetical protein
MKFQIATKLDEREDIGITPEMEDMTGAIFDFTDTSGSQRPHIQKSEPSFIYMNHWFWHPDWLIPLDEEAIELHNTSCNILGIKSKYFNRQLDLFNGD